jgi:hypothetical protein
MKPAEVQSRDGVADGSLDEEVLRSRDRAAVGAARRPDGPNGGPGSR